ncbi:MAG TPA: M48 family metallopeptidase [Chloroflexia bacterium]|jgi:hypothetical protein
MEQDLSLLAPPDYERHMTVTLITERKTEDSKLDERWQNAEDLRWAAKHWAVSIGVKVAAVHIRPMNTKWASMSKTGRMTLDQGLLEIPRYLGEFVIVHELVHLLAANHGRVFKSFMYVYMPDWEVREAVLRGYVNMIDHSD